jgi:cyclopropane fatty-acyl-phospholipid synthase-like methyltransferase
MLAQASTGNRRLAWTVGKAEDLGFAPASFDLIFSVDVIHHVGDHASFFLRASEVLASGGWICTVTDSSQDIRKREILSGYFPETVALELARYPRIDQIERWMAQADIEVKDAVSIKEDYELVSARAYQQKAYSALHLISHEAWRAGLDRLEVDLSKGPVRGTSRYTCVWGRKSPI